MNAVPSHTAERDRIREEYQRRARELDPNLYAPWQLGEIFLRSGGRRRAAVLLRQTDTFPGPRHSCLEIGFGSVGWLADLLGWGVPETNLHGIELDPERARKAQAVFPAADLRTGDATALPWDDRSFDLVIASTVFTSILDANVRRQVAQEIVRVLTPGGALLWYDFAVNNPRNPNVRRVRRRELRSLFPTLRGPIESVTLAPPIARPLARQSWTLATLLEAIPLLRTHLIGVLVKQ